MKILVITRIPALFQFTINYSIEFDLNVTIIILLLVSLLQSIIITTTIIIIVFIINTTFFSHLFE